ncbi:MAG: hypothetical protein AMXMBFR23_03160 [Chloroflexota bacterium]
MDSISGGVFANGGGRSAPHSPALTGGATPFANRTYGVGVSSEVNAQLSRSGVKVGGSFGVSGLVTFLLMLGGLLVVDRYVVDVPGVGK